MIKLTLIFFVTLLSLEAFSAREAIVTSEKAIIYSDQKMSSAVGFVVRGKKIRIGEIAKNQGQVYPIIVSGRIAFIRAVDVNAETEGMGSNLLIAERFQRNTTEKYTTNYGLSLFNYATSVSMAKDANGEITDGSSLNWYGVSLRGDVQYQESWGLGVQLNYMSAVQGQEKFNVIEIGIGPSYKLFERRKFQLTLDGQLMVIPFSNYSYSSEFRINGYGYTLGAGLRGTYQFGKSIGVFATAGMYYTALSGFREVDGYNQIEPSFTGNRLGLGLNYTF